MPNHPSAPPRLGVWIAGAKGDIATTLMVGTLALRKGLIRPSGMVTALAPFTDLPLAGLDALVFGGADRSDRRLEDAAQDLYRESRTISRELLDAVLPELRTIDADVSLVMDQYWSQAQRIAWIREELRAFRDRYALDALVVVNLTSVEPAPENPKRLATLAQVEAAIAADDRDDLTAGACYTYSALREGCPYVNFTPNAGPELGGLQELAEAQGLPLCGNDGKTGETLVKTALAPLFAARNLRVLSWEGVNMLGNNDGRCLDEPLNRVAKLKNKGGVLGAILGYEPHGRIDINLVPSLGDWKTAWDLIHFEGFMEVKMSMQFTWQGCDSILAAPLVLDLVRLTEFAWRSGEHGLMPQLAVFFKNPVGVQEAAMQRQFDALLNYAAAHAASTGGSPA